MKFRNIQKSITKVNENEQNSNCFFYTYSKERWIMELNNSNLSISCAYNGCIFGPNIFSLLIRHINGLRMQVLINGWEYANQRIF